MKTKLIFLIMLSTVIFTACKNQGNSKKSNHQDNLIEPLTSDSLQVKDPSNQSTAALPDIENNTAIWVYDYEADSIVKVKEVNQDALTYENLINLVNSGYKDKVLLNFSRIAHDTIFISIKKPEYLTQQMGSAGAFEFMIISTFTLTELPGIAFVSFDFQEGDHAAPGTYSRKYFLDWMMENRKLNKY